MNRTVSALFVSGRSIYKHLPGVVAYDFAKGAGAFGLDTPVVAHPPCRCWSKNLSRFVTLDGGARSSEMALGRSAVDVVRRCGGVLEQPAESGLWGDMGLPLPGDMADPFCYTLYLEQSWFGFGARKASWILVCGVPPGGLPPLPFRLMDRNLVSLDSMSQAERSRTMPAFADWLLTVARATWWLPERSRPRLLARSFSAEPVDYLG